MTIRCFLPLSQWNNYLMIYRKLYYKWLLYIKSNLEYELMPYAQDRFIIAMNYLLIHNYQKKELIYRPLVSFNIFYYDDYIDFGEFRSLHGSLFDTYNEIVNGAIRGGHIDIVKYYTIDWSLCTDDILCEACRYGRKDIIEYYAWNNCIKSYTLALNEASRSGHLDIVKFVLPKCNIRKNIKIAMSYALNYRNPQVYNYLKEHYDSY